MKTIDRIRARALWDNLSDRAQYFISWHSVNKIMPLDVLIELRQKGFYTLDGFTPIAHDAIWYGCNIANEYHSRTDPKGKHYPVSHIQSVGTLSAQTPLRRVYALKRGIVWRLADAGIVTLGDLRRLRRQYGMRWYYEVRGIGPRSADHIGEVLGDAFDALEQSA